MATTDARETIRRARDRIEEWKYMARDRAYSEMFLGSNGVLSEEELTLLDHIDSVLVRRGDIGLWDADEYGIVVGTHEEKPRVVCTYHPEIPYEGFRGEESLSEAIREEFNDVLWEYCERVATIMQQELEEFLNTHPR